VVADSGRVYAFAVAGEPFESFDVSTGSISLAAGGSQTLFLSPCRASAGDLYFVLGSATGTSPGQAVNGLVLPLNFDAYHLFTLLRTR